MSPAVPAGGRARVPAPALAFVLLLVALTVAARIVQYFDLDMPDFDAAIYSNLAYNIAQGDFFFSTVLNRNHLGEHFSPIMVLFAPFYMLAPSALWLYLAQALAIGCLYWLIYLIAAETFARALGEPNPLAGALFAFLAFTYVPLNSALLFAFHPSTFATPLIAAAILALHRGWNLAFWISLAVLLTAKENALLAVVGLAVYAWLVLGRFRLALVLFAVSAIGAVLIFAVIMPAFQQEGWSHYSRFGPLARPLDKLRYLFLLLLPLGFLPLFAWRQLAAAVPLLALNLSVSYWPQFSTGFQYDDFLSVFLLVAAVHGARNLAGWLRPRSARLAVLPLLWGLAFGLAHLAAGGNPVRTMVERWPSAEQRQLWREVNDFAALPPSQGMLTPEDWGGYLAHRPRYFHLYDFTLTEIRGFARPGDLVLMSPERHSNQHVELRQWLGEPGVSSIEHQSEVMVVYRVLQPAAAEPPAGGA